MPSCFGSVTTRVCTDTLNPAVFRVDEASCCASPITSGTGDCGTCPLLTVKVTVVPSGAVEPPAGVWAHTMPFGWAHGPSTGFGVNCAFTSVLVAVGSSIPTTLGTVPVFGAGGAGNCSTGRFWVATSITCCQIGAAASAPKPALPWSPAIDLFWYFA